MRVNVMDRMAFGRTGLTVSRLGFGGAQIGHARIDDATAEGVLHGVIDSGCNLLDTARSYGASEERIGRFLRGRRDQIVLSTKVGYGVEGLSDWTGECVSGGIERALRVLQTDRIEIVHLHSCPLDVLQRGDVIEALQRARAAGRIVAAAYSGDNAELDWAVASEAFDSVQCSINLCDQRALAEAVPAAGRAGLGVIGKRPLANAFWRFSQRPGGDYCEEYWVRARAMGLTPGELGWGELALRFSAFQAGVASVITGTASLEHWRENAAWLARGPLPAAIEQKLRADFLRHGGDWAGEI
jgi:aryl-alcohol dehydrogenase-like predicted oxidoreductase